MTLPYWGNLPIYESKLWLAGYHPSSSVLTHNHMFSKKNAGIHDISRQESHLLNPGDSLQWLQEFLLRCAMASIANGYCKWEATPKGMEDQRWLKRPTRFVFLCPLSLSLSMHKNQTYRIIVYIYILKERKSNHQYIFIQVLNHRTQRRSTEELPVRKKKKGVSP